MYCILIYFRATVSELPINKDTFLDSENTKGCYMLYRISYNVYIVYFVLNIYYAVEQIEISNSLICFKVSPTVSAMMAQWLMLSPQSKRILSSNLTRQSLQSEIVVNVLFLVQYKLPNSLFV